MRYTGPKARQCRRHRTNLYGTAKYTKILERRAGKPGMHGNNVFGKLSEYGVQLKEKQKARTMFGLSEKQFRNYVTKASKMQGETGENLLRLLEVRLDNVIYIAQFAITRIQSRQMASHGHFKLNGRRVDIPSIALRPGDKLELVSKLKTSPLYSELAKLKDFSPKWIQVDLKNMSLEVLSLPEKDDLEKSIDVQKIVEFYSR
ncbi:30S ribosomal protein S4 [Candidatus Peregrinibacteria bacterium]|nr:MAG: 30S ribosomal protein S4 [Candidatus Peregrinibacteria bacterium]